MMSTVESALKFQRAIHTLRERLEEHTDILVSRAKVLREAKRTPSGRDEIPHCDVTVHVSNNRQYVTLSGHNVISRGGGNSYCEFSMPLDYANGDDTVLKDLAAKWVVDDAAAERARNDLESHERAEFLRLQKIYGNN
jgi:hypothetical protein